MASEKQIRANRENAKKSTGPRSQAGKLRSSKNSRTTHKILVRDFESLPEFDEEGYDKLVDSLFAEYPPNTVTDEIRIRELASISWRLRRCARVDAELHAMGAMKAQKELGEVGALGAGFRIAAHHISSVSEIEHKLSRRFSRLVSELEHLRKTDFEFQKTKLRIAG